MNKKSKIVSTIICIMPLLISIALYSQLPDQIAIHWDSAGQPNNFVHKPIGAFGVPIFLTVIPPLYSFILYRKHKKE